MTATVKGVHRVANDINVVALVKGEERYVFLFSDEHRGDILRSMGRFASDPELSFSWYDAAVLSQKVRHEAETRFEMPAEATEDDDWGV